MPYLQRVGVLVDGQPHGKRGGTLRHAPRRRPDVLRIDLGDFGHAVHRIRAHALSQLFEPVAPVLDELVVVEVFLDDHVQKSQRQRPVRAGA